MSEADIHVDFGTVELHIELIELGRENIPAHGYPNIFETIFGPSNKRLQSKLDPKLGMAKTYFMWVCRALLFGSKTSHLGGSNGSSLFFCTDGLHVLLCDSKP